ncbi:3380_t:CDS:1 [Ambispora leptoticha]|uniref:3380_t:CDS:1 n=1 Tax=Ambispora leptoticha TaxID=144679 RepID=A0A9N9C1I5_9GLOM|nr:3380_t:CDS:1 [Ambispora leptoticha]
MNKQTSLMFCFTLIFIFAFSSSVNAMPKGIEKRQCTQVTRSCIMQSQQIPNARVDFQQQPDCSVFVQGSLEFIPSVVQKSSAFGDYDLHVVVNTNNVDKSATKYDLEDIIIPNDGGQDLVNSPFANVFDGSVFPSDFFTGPTQYFCEVAYDPNGDEFLASAPILPAP